MLVIAMSSALAFCGVMGAGAAATSVAPSNFSNSVVPPLASFAITMNNPSPIWLIPLEYPAAESWLSNGCADCALSKKSASRPPKSSSLRMPRSPLIGVSVVRVGASSLCCNPAVAACSGVTLERMSGGIGASVGVGTISSEAFSATGIGWASKSDTGASGVANAAAAAAGAVDCTSGVTNSLTTFSAGVGIGATGVEGAGGAGTCGACGACGAFHCSLMDGVGLPALSNRGTFVPGTVGAGVLLAIGISLPLASTTLPLPTSVGAFILIPYMLATSS